MTLDLSRREFRRLLDLVYIGNWIMNAESDAKERIQEYDALLSKIFAQCAAVDMPKLVNFIKGTAFPSRAFAEGGIHEAIATYEDIAFFEILAEELARRDMGFPTIGEDNMAELGDRIDAYIAEFETNGIEKLTIETS
jgi:hypothetical protein